jgi:hypothetical protein
LGLKDSEGRGESGFSGSFDFVTRKVRELLRSG